MTVLEKYLLIRVNKSFEEIIKDFSKIYPNLQITLSVRGALQK